MRRLFIDSSTSLMYVAYAKDDIQRDFSIRVAKRDHAKHMVDRIQMILKRNSVTIKDIDEIIVGVGPGSYTGIRIAVMVAKMIGFTRKMPVRTVSSLYFMTSGYRGRIAAMIDARRGNVFSCIHEEGNILLADGLRPYQELKSHLEELQAEPVFIDEMHYDVSIPDVIRHSVPVEDIHALEPNYLRITEAERTHDQTSDRT
jgi:tRNA threonylcarbamoyladenosine biosynthesis protein TsaB